jgi:hypothetical protein
MTPLASIRTGALAHHVVDEVRGAITVPGDVRLDFRAHRVTDGRLVVPVALANPVGLLQAGMRQPQGAQPTLRLSPLPRQIVVADIVGVGELLNVQQLAPLLPADDGEPLTVVRHLDVAQLLEGRQYLGLGQAVDVRTGELAGGAELANDQFVGLAAERVGAGLGDHLLLVDVGFQLVQLIDPIAGVVVLQRTFDRRVIDVHDRHLAVPRLGRCGSLADPLEDGRGADDVVLCADGTAQLRSHLLVLQMDFRFEVLDER